MAFDAAADLRDKIVPWLRALGHEVTYVPGWESRGAGRFARIETRLEHHDAFPASTGHAGGLRTCTFGRPDLRNSLCMFYFASDGVIWIVAAGISWHAGKGHITSNAVSAGSEARNSGLGEPWPAVQDRAMLDTDAICAIVWGTEVYEHKEHSSTGKIDRTGYDGPTWRSRVRAREAQLRQDGPNPDEEFTMDDQATEAFKALTDKVEAISERLDRRYPAACGRFWEPKHPDHNKVFIFTPTAKVHYTDWAAIEALIFMGLCAPLPEARRPARIDGAVLDAIPTVPVS